MEAWSDPLYNNTLDIFTTAVRNGDANNTYTAVAAFTIMV